MEGKKTNIVEGIVVGNNGLDSRSFVFHTHTFRYFPPTYLFPTPNRQFAIPDRALYLLLGIWPVIMYVVYVFCMWCFIGVVDLRLTLV